MSALTETGQLEIGNSAPVEAVQCVILRGVSWETYKRLLAEHQEKSSTHFTYDRGELEIMVLSPKHEKPNRILALLVEFWALVSDMDVENLGSTTFTRQDLARGFEPDTCFYIANAEQIRGKDEIDLTADPPPDLVIEIDITSPSLDKLPIFAAVGVPEVWRYDGREVSILKLDAGSYQAQAESLVLPGLTKEFIAQFILMSRTLKRRALFHLVQEWEQARRGSGA
ncbi:MAG TPA: Uma2 family endonuclease [Blastocatellia bacterium]|nr:Uma2 family endonuclease [Blastocatellia bacterium]